MWPTIKNGQTVLVLVGLFDRERIANGTIIVYKVNETYYVEHRIIEVHDGYYITKGDNNAMTDQWPVRPSSVYAVFIAVLW